MLILKKPVLPFRGNKKVWFNKFKEIITNLTYDNLTVVDVFGGSGLLSYWVKQFKPNYQVIYNDFDDFILRLEHMNETEIIRQRLREIIDNNRYAEASQLRTTEADNKDRALNKTCCDLIREELIKIKSDYPDYIDYITISSWLCFSAYKADSLDVIISKTKYYNRTPKEEIKRYDYLNNVEVIHKDASNPEEFINYINSIKQNENIIYILDPPYLYTETTGYANYKKEYFDMKANINLFYWFLHKIPCLFFTSNKSGLIESYNITNKLYNVNDEIKNNEIIKLTNTGGSRGLTYQEYLINRLNLGIDEIKT